METHAISHTHVKEMELLDVVISDDLDFDTLFYQCWLDGKKPDEAVLTKISAFRVSSVVSEASLRLLSQIILLAQLPLRPPSLLLHTTSHLVFNLGSMTISFKRSSIIIEPTKFSSII
jgi:hypothetical protein